ncbi:NADP-dependent oxidoreductase [Nocardioides acrostichi]|uniref:NADP-dependent oxidoreductase n=1 Tax=Nocardioides acrostichi TaxID=2784339 RepID=A0A930UXZ6_9ACTN|nr:NADP-dependent oxidoreductase [Nocardioides acrostichi]MBF4161125.1 NADP-dependent oxidoreductase [Nocardioides acrostichi]
MRSRRWVAMRPGGLEVFGLQERDVPAPGRGEVLIGVRAAGVNPADAKHVARGGFAGPRPVGYEVAGVVEGVGPDVTDWRAGDEVLAFRVLGGYADHLVAPASDVFAKPPGLGWAEAANLLLAGSTAADLLHRVAAPAGATVVLHAGSGSVGRMVLQLARRQDVRVVATCGPTRADDVRALGGTPLDYGPGLLERLRDLAPVEGYHAALDAAGTDEAIDASLSLVGPGRLVTAAGQARARAEGFTGLSGTDPESAAYRDSQRQHLVDLAGSGDLDVHVAHTFALDDALAALELVGTAHPGGKVALVP